ncbi:MAG: protoheme IX farnesyltransferase [Chloroflexi bacterium]|nr:protoheme IX farnesyltransferase [Chloroflexota bacterium]
MAVRQDIATGIAELPHAVVAPQGRGLLDVVRSYVALTKPRIVVLLLVTTVPAMILAEQGWPSLWLVLLTLFGGTLSAGGANAINCYMDRDIDAIMTRTKDRPIPAGLIDPERALVFGIFLGIAGFSVLAIGVNMLTALLATGALLFYVFVYTMWLKRTSAHNIVIGGAAGAIPPMTGWAAVTGSLDWPALVLFGIVFLWTPPHFWALALRYRHDYARASVPMLPVARGEPETYRQIMLYSFVLVASSLMLVPIAGMGLLYLTVALVLGVGFIAYAFRLWKGQDARASMALFFYSLPYLGLLFVAVGIDEFLHF